MRQRPVCGELSHRSTGDERSPRRRTGVWFDAHADLDVPGGSPTDYLGGMAVSGPLGWWDSGLGAGLSPHQLLLVGTRSIDEAEKKPIDLCEISVLTPADSNGSTPAELVAGRPVYVHIDCDVLEPGLFTTEYREPGGLPLAQLDELASALARGPSSSWV